MTTPANTGEHDKYSSEHHDQVFGTTLDEFLNSLVARFPEKSGIRMATTLSSAMIDPASLKMKRDGWAEFCQPILQGIMDQDIEQVGEAFEVAAAANMVMSNMALHKIMVEPETDYMTKQTIWSYMKTLSVISLQGTGVVIPKSRPAKATPTHVAMSPPSLLQHSNTTSQVQAAPAPAPAAGKPDVGKVIEGFTDAMPKVMEAFNKIMKDDGGDNPMAQMFKQFMNPNQLQPGVMNNLAANAMEGDMGPVMGDLQGAMGNVTMADMMSRIQKLEKDNGKLKRKVAKAKSTSNGNGLD